MWPTRQAQPVAGVLALAAPRKGCRTEREPRVETRFAAVSLNAPHAHRRAVPIAVWAVLAQERDATSGVKP
jgi:hypothetical protein